VITQSWPYRIAAWRLRRHKVAAGVVLISSTQALGLELFRNLGIEPTERKLVILKSTVLHGGVGSIARKVIYVDPTAR
jgi:microcystin degradation protein MlrC